ncbi:TonB-dependent receptor plug domain-containing protein [Thermoflexibacter ruber]|uniref:Iron complex outermembrane recepter protein n=1 Tax=Thermoflexibacter ruber TaxID=1003 RepID=A0A1I2AZ52_9BACT|nr:TonB-dependent receptor [Thermoflexibacter ruber]SFE49182.1 iron complex outermembrane recepter protein [Thermoflexibacter ruber]
MFLSKKNILFFAIGLLCTSQILFAQRKPDIGAKELFNISLEDLLNVGIVSASKKKQSVSDAPAMAYVFTKEQILARGYSNLVELLEDVPEIEIQRNSNPEDRNFATIRGITGNEKFLILLNGIRITPATGDAYTLGANFALTNALRVEVILGPASALYGVDAFSGIINIITTHGQEGNPLRGVNANVNYGQFRTLDTSLQLGKKFDKLNVMFSGNFHQSAEPDYQNIYKDEFAWYNNNLRTSNQVINSPFIKLINTLDNFQSLAEPYFFGSPLSNGFDMPTKSYFVNGTLNYADFTVSYVRHWESHSAAHGLRPEFAVRDPQALIEMSQEVFYAKHNYTSINRKWNVQSTISKSAFEIGNQSHFAGSATTWQRGYIYSLASSSKIEEQFSYDFSKKVSLITGFTAENLSAIPKIAPVYKPFDTRLPASLQQLYYVAATGKGTAEDSLIRNAFVEQRVFNVEYRNYGGYLQMQLSPAKWIELTLGSRYDYNTRFGGSINPRLGLVMSSTNKKLVYKLLYGEAFLAPSPEKTFAQSASFAVRFLNDTEGERIASYFRTANPDLKPEKLRTLESSLSYLLTPQLALGANGFYTRVENLIGLAEANPQTTPAPVPVSRLETNVNRGQSEIYGGTFKINYLQKFDFLTINALLAYSYIDGNIDNQPLLYTAKHTAKASLDISNPRFSISPRLIFRTASNSRLINPNNSDNFFTNQPFTVVNLFARLKLYEKRNIGKFYIYTKINNLLNLKYYHVFLGAEDGFPATPQDPRRINIGINWALE